MQKESKVMHAYKWPCITLFEKVQRPMQTFDTCDLNENSMPLSEPSTSRRSGGNDTHLGNDDQDMNGFS